MVRIDKGDRLLLLAPHADDIEFSCGASVKKWSDAGAEIWYAAFSPCNESLPEEMPENSLYHELAKAVTHLGLDSDKVLTYNFPVRYFYQNRQDILEIMVQLRKKIEPNWVLLPNSNDIHQDHKQIYEEGLRAFKHCSLLGYELVWNNFVFNSSCHSSVTREQLEAKVAAIKEYTSQRSRPYSKPDYVFGHARVRGQLIKAEYAECFEAIHLVL